MVDLKSKFNTKVKLWLGALVVMSYVNFMVGCGEEEKSELQINLVLPAAAPSGEKDTQMEFEQVTQIRVQISTAGIDSRFTLTGRTTSVTIDEIPPGNHMVSVHLLSANNKLMFTGQESVNVIEGKATQKAIQVKPTSGRQLTLAMAVRSTSGKPVKGDPTTTFYVDLTAFDTHFDRSHFEYQLDWGDGTIIPFEKDPLAQEELTYTHKYIKLGRHMVKAVVKSGGGITTGAVEVLTIINESELSINRDFIYLTEDEEDSFILETEGQGVTNWKITESPRWLALSKNSGSLTTGKSDRIAISVKSLSGLADYGEIVVKSDDGEQVITVYVIKESREVSQVFTEDFGDGVADDWKEKLGSWSVKNGKYAPASAHDETLAVFGEDNWRDMTIEADLILPDDLNESVSRGRIFVRSDMRSLSGIALELGWSGDNRPCWNFEIWKNGRNIYGQSSCWYHSRNGSIPIKIEIKGETLTANVGGVQDSISMKTFRFLPNMPGSIPVTGGIGLNFWAGGRGGNTDGMGLDNIRVTVHSVID